MEFKINKKNLKTVRETMNQLLYFTDDHDEELWIESDGFHFKYNGNEVRVTIGDKGETDIYVNGLKDFVTPVSIKVQRALRGMS